MKRALVVAAIAAVMVASSASAQYGVYPWLEDHFVGELTNLAPGLVLGEQVKWNTTYDYSQNYGDHNYLWNINLGEYENKRSIGLPRTMDPGENLWFSLGDAYQVSKVIVLFCHRALQNRPEVGTSKPAKLGAG